MNFLSFGFFLICFSLFSIELKTGLQTICIPEKNFSPCKKNQIGVDIFIPQKKTQKNILVLNGWNFPKEDWHKKTDILKFAEENSYVLIFPAMGKTLYESEYYPETKMKWHIVPGGKWIPEIFIPEMQNMGLLKTDQKNFIMGLSTGGRGAALVALSCTNLFKGVASISGDFDQSKMPKDRIMTMVYGNFSDFPDRWINSDNPQAKISLWNIPIYLGHGRADKIVPFNQTEIFYKTLQSNHPNLKIKFNDPKTSGHDFTYWNSEVKPIFEFFNQL